MGQEAANPPINSIGSYDILSKIAEGGMGTVYKGRHRSTGQLVAIKIVPPHAARNNVLLKRFEREFAAAHALDHPNIVKAIEFDGVCPTPFLVMEFVDGESIGDRIERSGLIPENEAVRLIAQVGRGLRIAHKQGLVHRDVKPDNVLINKEGQAKLTDLGLVKDAAEDYNLTRTGRGLGTPHFMAPEQFKNAKNADARCDIYSLGATLYMMVTGQTPFGDCTALECFLKKTRNELIPPREVVPTLSERVDWAIRRAMSPNPEQRPATCREFVEDLIGQSTRPQSPAEKALIEADIWYLVYKDEFGVSHTVKGGVEGIRRALQDRLLGDTSTIMACRQKQGPFLDLKNYPEFRDLLISPEALPPAGKSPPKPAAKASPPPLPPIVKPVPPVVKAPPPAPVVVAPAAVPPPLPVAEKSAPAAPLVAAPPVPAAAPAVAAIAPVTLRPRTDADRPPSMPDLMAWRGKRAPHSLSDTGRSIGYDILLWVLVMAGALVAALIVFYFFPPG
jgi:serine/threonine protein kinase